MMNWREYMTNLSHKTTVQEAVAAGKEAFFQGAYEVAPKSLRWYTRKEWLRGWQAGYHQQQLKSEREYDL